VCGVFTVDTSTLIYGEFTNCEFVNLTMTENNGVGSGFWANGGIFKFKLCLFENVISLESGGAIYYSGTGDMIFEECTFKSIINSIIIKILFSFYYYYYLNVIIRLCKWESW
jgi:hypothetical protein